MNEGAEEVRISSLNVIPSRGTLGGMFASLVEQMVHDEPSLSAPAAVQLPQNVLVLMNMGFSTDVATEALARTADDIAAAIELIVTGSVGQESLPPEDDGGIPGSAASTPVNENSDDDSLSEDDPTEESLPPRRRILTARRWRSEAEQRRRSGIVPGNQPAPRKMLVQPRVEAARPTGPVCAICLEELAGEGGAPVCGHTLHAECWRGLFTALIRDGKVASVSCPIPGCGRLIPDDEITSAVSVEDAEKYARYKAASILAADPSVKWCPAKGCGKAVRGWVWSPPPTPMLLSGAIYVVGLSAAAALGWVGGIIVHAAAGVSLQFAHGCIYAATMALGATFIAWSMSCDRRTMNPPRKKSTCSCRASMCFSCGSHWHEGSCNAFDDMKMVAWARQRDTGRCPSCQAFIERVDGCNHMTCRCGYSFCWLCDQPYSIGHFTTGQCVQFGGVARGVVKIARRRPQQASAFADAVIYLLLFHAWCSPTTSSARWLTLSGYHPAAWLPAWLPAVVPAVVPACLLSLLALSVAVTSQLRASLVRSGRVSGQDAGVVRVVAEIGALYFVFKLGSGVLRYFPSYAATLLSYGWLRSVLAIASSSIVFCLCASVAAVLRQRDRVNLEAGAIQLIFDKSLLPCLVLVPIGSCVGSVLITGGLRFFSDHAFSLCFVGLAISFLYSFRASSLIWLMPLGVFVVSFVLTCDVFRLIGLFIDYAYCAVVEVLLGVAVTAFCSVIECKLGRLTMNMSSEDSAIDSLPYPRIVSAPFGSRLMKFTIGPRLVRILCHAGPSCIHAALVLLSLRLEASPMLRGRPSLQGGTLQAAAALAWWATSPELNRAAVRRRVAADAYFTTTLALRAAVAFIVGWPLRAAAAPAAVLCVLCSHLILPSSRRHFHSIMSVLLDPLIGGSRAALMFLFRWDAASLKLNISMALISLMLMAAAMSAILYALWRLSEFILYYNPQDFSAVSTILVHATLLASAPVGSYFLSSQSFDTFCADSLVKAGHKLKSISKIERKWSQAAGTFSGLWTQVKHHWGPLFVLYSAIYLSILLPGFPKGGAILVFIVSTTFAYSQRIFGVYDGQPFP